MRRLAMLLLMTTVLLLPRLCAAEEKTKPGPQAEPGKTYVIHLTTGGSIQTDNYTMEKGKVRVMLPTGAIYLEKDMVRNVEEVQGVERETVKTITVEPEPQERPAGQTTPPSTAPSAPTTLAPPAPAPYVATDDKGHDEEWWQKKVTEWKDRKADARIRFQKAQTEWNNYNGQLNALSGGGVPFSNSTTQALASQSRSSQYDVIRLQDLRGASRLDMDKAQADMDEADRMLNNELPDQARKAGAPPGWVR